MKPLREALKKISEKSKSDLLKKLGIGRFSEKSLIAELQSPAGLNAVLSELTESELILLKNAYQSGDGITFSDAAGILSADVNAVAEMTRSLSGRLLLYIMKNRQHLNMRLDKMFGIDEIAPFLNLVSQKHISAHVSAVAALLRKGEPEQPLKISANESAVLIFCAEHGFIAPLEDIEKNFTPHTSTLLSSLHKKGIIKIFHCIGTKLATFCAIDEKYARAAAALLTPEKASEKTRTGNRCFVLINFLRAYDIISSSGLFLTKQNEFRKADLKRISDAMIQIYDTNGRKIPKEEMACLCLFFLNTAGCLDILKDAATISFKDFRSDIVYPHTLAVKILKSVDRKTGNTYFFPSPMAMPDEKTVSQLFRLLQGRTHHPLKWVKSLILANMLASADENDIAASIRGAEVKADEIERGINLLCVLGAVGVENGLLFLTDSGGQISARIFRHEHPKAVAPLEKCIFVNPDYTVALPEVDVSTEELYHILSFCEIERIDVMINARITKASVTGALKRGMTPEHFIDTLRNLSKNGIPQNLEFQINDWFIRTIKIDVSQPVLLKASDPLFLDELGYGDFAAGVIERISPGYAVIKKEFLDDIVEFARKKDCLISLFSDDE